MQATQPSIETHTTPRHGGCLNHCLTTQSSLTWAEDTALQRCNRSAVPGVGVEDRVGQNPGSLSHQLPPLQLQHQSAKLSRHDAVTVPTGRHPFTNTRQTIFHFPMNQDTPRFSLPRSQYCGQRPQSEHPTTTDHLGATLFLHIPHRKALHFFSDVYTFVS